VLSDDGYFFLVCDTPRQHTSVSGFVDRFESSYALHDLNMDVALDVNEAQSLSLMWFAPRYSGDGDGSEKDVAKRAALRVKREALRDKRATETDEMKLDELRDKVQSFREPV